MNLPHIQIRTEAARIGIEAPRGAQQLEQPRATLEMRQIRPELNTQRTDGYLEVNQDRAWDALALGNNLETMSKIYSMASNIALQGLARIVENGNRMAAIHHDVNPFAEMASDWKRTFPEFDFRGPASVLNVDMRYTPGKLSFQPERGRIDINTAVNAPIHDYRAGQVSIYMQQYGQVEIIPPKLDISA